MPACLSLLLSLCLLQKIERPLSNLINDLVIPPPQATAILDTDVSEEWLNFIPDFEQRLSALKSRMKVKAARDLNDVAEGLRIVVSPSHPSSVYFSCPPGSYQNSRILPLPLHPNPYQHEYKHTRPPDLRPLEIPTLVRLPPPPCSSSRTRGPTVLYCFSANLLRDWLSTLRSKSRCRAHSLSRKVGHDRIFRRSFDSSRHGPSHACSD